MSIIIKGMEMPQNCDKCRFQSALRLYCDAMPYNFCGNTDDIERPEWCPLTELPPHGRLGDLDELIEKYGEWYTEEGTESGYIGTMKSLLKGAPTVIESED